MYILAVRVKGLKEHPVCIPFACVLDTKCNIHRGVVRNMPLCVCECVCVWVCVWLSMRRKEGGRKEGEFGSTLLTCGYPGVHASLV